MAIWHVIHPLSLVFVALSVTEHPISLSEVIFEMPNIIAAVTVNKLAFTISLAISECALEIVALLEI